VLASPLPITSEHVVSCNLVLATGQRSLVLRLLLELHKKAEKRGDNDEGWLQIELAKEGRFVYAHEIPGGWLRGLARRLRQPRYFLNNAQDVSTEDDTTAEDQLRKTHFPSFFFGAAGSSSPLHSDGAPTFCFRVIGTFLLLFDLE
jgi:hypothetical protein